MNRIDEPIKRGPLISRRAYLRGAFDLVFAKVLQHPLITNVHDYLSDGPANEPQAPTLAATTALDAISRSDPKLGGTGRNRQGKKPVPERIRRTLSKPTIGGGRVGRLTHKHLLEKP